MSLDTRRIEKAGWDIKVCENILRLFTSNVQICCFSNGYRKRIPLWSHYSNNHQGFCVEYSTTNKNRIFPVRYSNERLISATIITRLCKAFMDGYSQNKEPNSDFWHYYQILFTTFCTKSAEWQYEHEFRFFNPSDEPGRPGELVSLESTGLQYNKIFIGLNCKPNNEKELIRIANALKVPVYKMKIVDYTKYFSLRSFLIK